MVSAVVMGEAVKTMKDGDSSDSSQSSVPSDDAKVSDENFAKVKIALEPDKKGFRDLLRNTRKRYLAKTTKAKPKVVFTCKL